MALGLFIVFAMVALVENDVVEFVHEMPFWLVILVKYIVLLITS